MEPREIGVVVCVCGGVCWCVCVGVDMEMRILQ